MRRNNGKISYRGRKAAREGTITQTRAAQLSLETLDQDFTTTYGEIDSRMRRERTSRDLHSVQITLKTLCKFNVNL